MTGWCAQLPCISVVRSSLALALLWANPQSVEAYGEMNKFLIVSSSVTHEIGYAAIPQEANPSALRLRQLIGSGLTFPQGLAVDQWRRYLYVADPTLNKLVYYELQPQNEEKLYVGSQKIAANNVETRWVSCDSLGNVYFTVENTQKVMRITATMLDSGNVMPEVVFAGSSSSRVSAPGGIAIDNYFVYWINKLDPAKAGTMVRALHAPNTTTTEMASINVKCYGVCQAVNNMFFTDETKNLYGVPRLGGVTPVTVSSNFEEPRGCSYDGMNTVYVADKKKNAVFSFPANMANLRESIPISLTAYMQGAYGVAVYTVSESGDAFGLVAGLFPMLLASALSMLSL